jgi:hypothetical protein
MPLQGLATTLGRKATPVITAAISMGAYRMAGRLP